MYIIFVGVQRWPKRPGQGCSPDVASQRIFCSVMHGEVNAIYVYYILYICYILYMYHICGCAAVAKAFGTGLQPCPERVTVRILVYLMIYDSG